MRAVTMARDGASRHEEQAPLGKITLLFGTLLLGILVFFCYWDALRGDFIWDDDHYVTQNDTLKTPDGLRRIWCDPRATPQYYPLVFTSFRLEYQVWGLNPIGYHLTNFFLHACNATLVWFVLRVLSVPGAWLAAAIFAVHPVHVESVAWITERKNVLSGFFSLGSMLAYLSFHARSTGSSNGPSRLYVFQGRYLCALMLFLLALLSKTVAVTLPAVLAIVLWWRSDPVQKRIFLPLVPFLLLGLPFALLTIWLERHHVGAVGHDWNTTPVERFLVAGRALWFYIGKLLAPQDLMFNYPRWQVDPGSWLQWLYPLSFLALLVGALSLRRRITRGAATALLCYCAVISPAIGLVDVYPMRYSFVADHFQYLASVSVTALVAAVIWRAATSGCSCMPLRNWAQTRCATVLRVAVSAALLTGLAHLAREQARAYAGPEVLWRSTLLKNPDSWLSHINLGSLLETRGQFKEAHDHFEEVLRIRPGHANALFNLGVLSERTGELLHAQDYFERALRSDPANASTYFRLGGILDRKGDVQGARLQYERALRLEPSLAPLLLNQAVEQHRKGRLPEALSVLDGILHMLPSYPMAYFNRGVVLQAMGDEDRARVSYEHAIRLDPLHAMAHNNLALILERQGEHGRAGIHLEAALRIDPAFAGARLNLGYVSERAGDLEGAVRNYQAALTLDPDLAAAKSNLARVKAMIGR